MVHVWRACAYSQKHRWLRETGGGEAALREVRGAVLASAGRAVELAPDPTSVPRRLFRRLLDPRAEQGDPSDNDLEDFMGDEQFRALIVGSAAEAAEPATSR